MVIPTGDVWGMCEAVCHATMGDCYAQLGNEPKMISEYQQAARLDETQKQSLNATARVKVSENMPNMLGGTSVNVHVGATTCPVCGQQIEDNDISCCPIYGKDLK